MFFFFSNRFGCLGSIVISVVLSALLILAVRAALERGFDSGATCHENRRDSAGIHISYPDRRIYPDQGISKVQHALVASAVGGAIAEPRCDFREALHRVVPGGEQVGHLLIELAEVIVD